jgi:hypothetical protein
MACMKKFITIILVLTVIGGLGYGGWYFYNKNKTTNGQQVNQQSQAITSQSNPTDENGQYLVINEWGVRFVVPESLKNRVSYQASPDITDSDNIAFQTTKLYLPKDLNSGSECNIKVIDSKQLIDTNIMILRVPRNVNFNTERYKGTFKEAVYHDEQYSYHINYLTPPCASPSLENLINSLERSTETTLQKSS